MIDAVLLIDDLMPDFLNPRIGNAATRLESINRIVSLQGPKLVNLAQSILSNGLSPIDRLLVIKDEKFPEHHVVIEGNRRATAMILLANPRLIETLDAFESSADLKRCKAKLLGLAASFSRSTVEPIKVVLAPNREATRYWVQLRHSGEGDGVGVTRWRVIESARFTDPKSRIVAVADLLFTEGDLSGVEKEMLDELAWSTFDRFIDSPRLREVLCFEVVEGMVITTSPRNRVVNALREIAFRVAKGEFDSRKQNSVEDRLNALAQLPSGVLPPRPTVERSGEGDEEGLHGSDPVEKDPPAAIGTKPDVTGVLPAVKSTKSTTRAKDRLFRRSDFVVTEPRLQDILKELSDLPLSSKPNACAVLLRVFLEMSVLHYLQDAGQGTDGRGGKQAELFVLVERAFKHMKLKDPSLQMPQIESLVAAQTTGLRLRELHSYVHNRHYFPAPADLLAAAGELTPFLRKIWS
ncbi:MAG: hypothetical protein Q7J44_14260 [Pseudotabrizicola sp.]|uniref:hypothetical protein n=1 Tax=Pseudotabrizicola sp. TaxID=2939647 RepID=UPI0027247C6A|nr:hypothetical protein [Pseudotabrizicola sp.]MDO9639700.1 hypothetical protein [Pseudotabrizicola sp.]